MGTTLQKVQAAQASKEACYDAIVEKGGTITSATKFADYGDAIRSIPAGGEIPETDAVPADVRPGKTFVMNVSGSAVQTTGSMQEASFIDDTSSAYIGIGYNGTARTILKGGGELVDSIGLYDGTVTGDVASGATIKLHGSACLVANTVKGSVNLYESGQPNNGDSEPVITGYPTLMGSGGNAVQIEGTMFVVGNTGDSSAQPVVSGDVIVTSGALVYTTAYDSSGSSGTIDHAVCQGTMTVLEGGISSDCYGYTTVNSGGTVTCTSGGYTGAGNFINTDGFTSVSYCPSVGATVTGGSMSVEYSAPAVDVQGGTMSLSSNTLQSLNQTGGELYCDFGDIQACSNSSITGGTLYLTGSASEYISNTVTTYGTVTLADYSFDAGNKLAVYGSALLPQNSTISGIQLYGSASIGSGATLDCYASSAYIENTSGGYFGYSGSYNGTFSDCTIQNDNSYVYATADGYGSSYINGGHFDGTVNGGSVFVSSASVDAQVQSGYIELRNCSCSYQVSLNGGTMTLADYSATTVQMQTWSNPHLTISSGCTATVRNSESEVAAYITVEEGGVVIYQPN